MCKLHFCLGVDTSWQLCLGCQRILCHTIWSVEVWWKIYPVLLEPTYLPDFSMHWSSLWHKQAAFYLFVCRTRAKVAKKLSEKVQSNFWLKNDNPIHSVKICTNKNKISYKKTQKYSKYKDMNVTEYLKISVNKVYAGRLKIITV